LKSGSFLNFIRGFDYEEKIITENYKKLAASTSLKPKRSMNKFISLITAITLLITATILLIIAVKI